MVMGAVVDQQNKPIQAQIRLDRGKKNDHVWKTLENGQFALYPNNRIRIFDLSITPSDPKTPDFKVSTKYYQVENGIKWGRLGDTNDYHWKTPEEESSQ